MGVYPLSLALAATGVALLGIMVLLAERLLPHPTPGQPPDAVRQLLQLCGRVFVMVAVVALTGPLVPAVLVALVASLLVASWRVGWISIVGTLAAAADRHVPFDSALAALAEEERWVGHRPARHLLKLLQMGWPLPDALEQTRNPLPRECLAAVRVGQEVGDLATPLRQAYRRLAGKGDYWGDLGLRLYFLVITGIYYLMVSFFLQFRIAPAFVMILGDYGTSLPPLSSAVLKGFWFSPFAEYGFALLFPTLGLAVMYALFRYAGAIRWVPPGFGWVVRPFRSADVLEALALAARRNRSLVGPLAILAHEYPGWAFGRRLRRVYGDVQAGADWCRSLQRRGVIGRAEAMVLEAAGRAGNLSWALEEMAASLRRRHAYRLRALALALFPVCVVALGAAVGVLVVAYFYPLVIMIQDLATL